MICVIDIVVIFLDYWYNSGMILLVRFFVILWSVFYNVYFMNFIMMVICVVLVYVFVFVDFINIESIIFVRLRSVFIFVNIV